MNIVILGGPNTGKTTFAKAIAESKPLKVMHTDDLMGKQWSEASEEASKWFDESDWIIEGTMAVRALRKWLDSNPKKKLDAKVYFLTKQMAEYDSDGQQSMAKGCRTIFDGITNELRRRKIEFKILHGDPKE